MESEWACFFQQAVLPQDSDEAYARRDASAAAISAAASERHTVDIHRAVLRRLFGVHGYHEQGVRKPFLFVLYSEKFHSADGSAEADGRLILSATLRKGIDRGLADLPMQIVWVEDFCSVCRDADAEYVPDGGAVVRLDGIRFEGCDLAVAEGYLHRWGMPPQKFEHVLERKSGFWMVKSSYQKSHA